jgi:hypothetical protein
MVWIILFLKILILGNRDKVRLNNIINALSSLDLFGILIKIYIRITEENLRNLYLENFCNCKQGDKNPVCLDEFCENEKICQLTKRVINSSLELYLILTWLQEYHDFQAKFEDSISIIKEIYPK